MLDPAEFDDDDTFLDIAASAAAKSKNKWTKDGACIVSPEGRLIATGCNSWGSPAEPAEVSAIMSTDADLEGCDLYVTRFYPSLDTLLLIRDEGITRVISNACPIETDNSHKNFVAGFLDDNDIAWSRVFKFIVNPRDLF